MRKEIYTVIIACLFSNALIAQEGTQALRSNVWLNKSTTIPTSNTRASLPFIDDFSYESHIPDQNLWEDKLAFVNNTLAINPPTRGVATLDGLNEFGRPYNAIDFGHRGYGDSLTSCPINLATNSIADSLYLSFQVQPQGNGFAPEFGDSLYLYFKDGSNVWQRMWAKEGSGTYPFLNINLPILDQSFFHATFQFRFVNITSLNLNDDLWHIDYVKLDANRMAGDTVLNDVAFTEYPSSLLANYSSMPYRHFLANQVAETSTTQDVFLRNNSFIPSNVSINLNAIEENTLTPLHNSVLPTTSLGGYSNATASHATYPIAFMPSGTNDQVIFESTYSFAPLGGSDLVANNTIVHRTVFDNYFAYDDGSSESAYFLFPSSNFASKTALKFTLNQADTVQGLMVHFEAQVPSASGKFFSIVLYEFLGSLGGSDSIIHQEDLFNVMYSGSQDGFTTYGFSQPVSLDAGTYYMGITQPANFGSDSIYYGLDVNTNTNLQNLSYNVNGFWYNSNVVGSIMMRPIVGGSFTPTSIGELMVDHIDIYPNPSNGVFQLSKEIDSYSLYSVSGKLLDSKVLSGTTIDITQYSPGMYILDLRVGNQSIKKKIWKR